jgi:hypothetical protein
MVFPNVDTCINLKNFIAVIIFVTKQKLTIKIGMWKTEDNLDVDDLDVDDLDVDDLDVDDLDVDELDVDDLDVDDLDVDDLDVDDLDQSRLRCFVFSRFHKTKAFPFW